MLEVKNISKTYPGEDFGALKSVSLSVKENQVLALVGKSGSGKSTMLQIIAGLMKPDEGEVIFKGEPLDDPNEQLIAGHPKIKVVFQDFQLKPNMTVEENIKYKLLQFDNAYQAERTAELLALCNLSDLAKRKPRELSGGQKQRVSIARALADDPELLLMDEPFSNLDPLTKEELLIELVDIVRAEGLGLVFVTHETKDALLVANQVAFLADGQLIQNDTTEKVYNQPNTLEIGQFFGRINDLSLVTNEPNAYVRAEHIHLGDDYDRVITILIRRSIFMGAFYMHEASEKHTESRIFFYSTDSLAANSEVIAGFDSEKILSF